MAPKIDDVYLIQLLLNMTNHKPFDIEIDKLARSIENAITGDSFKTNVLELNSKDIKSLKKLDWLFDWKTEAKQADKTIYKLVIIDNAAIIQGLISLQDRGDHFFMPLIESNKFSRGTKKVYLGVPGNLVAFACKLSFDKSYGGYVSFESKSRLKEHYQKTLGPMYFLATLWLLTLKLRINLLNNIFLKKSNLQSMIKEARNIDFYTTGRQPSQQDFARISEWIKKDKEKQNLHNRKSLRKKAKQKI
jgi:hypothetical protein